MIFDTFDESAHRTLAVPELDFVAMIGPNSCRAQDTLRSSLTDPVGDSWFDSEDLGAFGATSPELVLQPVEKSVERKVLLLEDDPVQLMLLEQHLEALGLKTFSASTIEQARKRLYETRFELALFDIQLPDGNGLELCAQIDEDPDLMGLPVIVLSSLQQEQIVKETRAAGGSFFISKPYDPNVLLTIIEHILGASL